MADKLHDAAVRAAEKWYQTDYEWDGVSGSMEIQLAQIISAAIDDYLKSEGLACRCGPVGSEGPEPDCPQHGKQYADWEREFAGRLKREGWEELREVAEKYLAEVDNPAPDFTMRRVHRKEMREALRRVRGSDE